MIDGGGGVMRALIPGHMLNANPTGLASSNIMLPNNTRIKYRIIKSRLCLFTQ
jgi:hypothetical protein